MAGGYQAPANPAPVSLPGALSSRTDGQPVASLPDAAYGEQKTFRADQQGAPMATTPGGSAAPQVNPADLAGVVGLGAPSGRPGEPVTSGAALGPGPGAEALGIPGAEAADRETLRQLLPTLELMANMPSASQLFRQTVRRIRAEV